jgi:hypothetical protein
MRGGGGGGHPRKAVSLVPSLYLLGPFSGVKNARYILAYGSVYLEADHILLHVNANAVLAVDASFIC